MNKQEANKTIGKKYVGTLKADSKTRVDCKGESTKKSVPIHHLSVAICARIASYNRLGVQRNTNDTPSIIRAINAIPLHLGPNDENAATTIDTVLIVKTVGVTIKQLSLTVIRLHIIVITYLRQLLNSSFPPLTI